VPRAGCALPLPGAQQVEGVLFALGHIRLIEGIGAQDGTSRGRWSSACIATTPYVSCPGDEGFEAYLDATANIPTAVFTISSADNPR
jgi:hypothetical protein